MSVNRTTRKLRNLEYTWLISQLGIYIGSACFFLVAPFEQSKGVEEAGTWRRIRWSID